ncbi:ester cyclase [Leptospira sp. FAT2]|uniref:ester cyclase n=1 Tax=Leptospira sanjuanensis TaxID=2879643 RepID=UPI001EE86012|nr:ester cyclase [Leptospira sanjuanensis]MCG6167224.1 ester cyclase [Leptospira sanjuanensis]MCG6192649.1 ester cyclase [Leptospira sanjuanensis]
MNNRSPKQIAMSWIEAYNSHNPDAAISLYDENIANLQFPWGKTVQGREAMRNTYVNVFKAFPDIRIEVMNMIEQEPWVVVEWRFSGTMKGEFAGHTPNNNSFDMHGCEIFQIVNGKILVQHGYWDKETMFSQLKIDMNR